MASLALSPFPDPSHHPAPRPSIVLEPAPALDEIVSALHEAARLEGLQRALAIGRVLSKHLHDGDPVAFRRRSSKAVSLRRLVRHGSPVSAAALYRAQSIFEIWTRVGGRRWPSLTASHYRSVESISGEEQHRWLSLAAQRGWSAAQLRGAIVAGCGQVVSRGGRLPKHPIARFATRLERELARLAPVTRRIRVTETERVRMTELATRLESIATECLDYAKRIRAASRGE